MKKIVLVRHAEAVSKEAGIPDRERSLVRRGVRDARAVAKRLRKQELAPDLIVSSPANRALETAHLVAEGIGYPLEKILVEPALYERTDAGALLELIKKWPEEARTVIFCGHDPQFSVAAGLLASEFVEKLPKAAALGLAFEVEGWSQLEAGGGRVFLFDTPLTREEKRRLLGEARLELVERLALRLETELAAVSPEAAGKVHGAALKAAERLVERFLERARKSELLLRHRLRAGAGGGPAEDR